MYPRKQYIEHSSTLTAFQALGGQFVIQLLHNKKYSTFVELPDRYLLHVLAEMIPTTKKAGPPRGMQKYKQKKCNEKSRLPTLRI